MLMPLYKNLDIHKTKDGLPAIVIAGAVGRHRDPRLNKYYWWVFTAGCPVDGRAFLSDRYRLTESEFEDVYRRCREQGIAALIYNARYYRIGDDTPWDRDRLMAKGITNFAPSYDADPDPIARNGYR